MYLLIGVTAFPRCKYPFFGHFSPIATDLTDWFRGSALEPTDLQALPAESSSIRVSLSLRSEAKPRGQCVPRQSPETRKFTGGVSREVSFFEQPRFPLWDDFDRGRTISTHREYVVTNLTQATKMPTLTVSEVVWVQLKASCAVNWIFTNINL